MTARGKLIILGGATGVALWWGALTFLSTDATAPEVEQGCALDSEIRPEPQESLIRQGEVVKLRARAFTCEGTKEVAVDNLTWQSEDQSVVTVNENGEAKGISPGSTGVLASSERYAQIWRFSITVANR